jgi:catecholate siderophore receptor
MCTRPLSLVVLAISVLGHVNNAVASEGQSGRISGTVVDSSGGAVVGATVVMRPNAVGERRAATDSAGRFAFENVAAGPATVTVTFDRFAPLTVDADPAGGELRIVLQPVPLAEEVTVTAPRLVVQRTRTATRTDTPLRDVPQAVTIITRDLIADQTMNSVADVVRYVPGVGIGQGEGNRDTPIFRGNSSTADFFVDGVRDDVQYMRDLYNVERVEALKGPNAMVFGRGGVGGVINRVVRRADWGTAREVTAQLGSYGGRRLTADFGQALNQKLALRMTGVYEDSDTYREGTDISRYGVNPTIALSLGPMTVLRAGYEHFEDDRTADRGIPSVNGRPVETDAETFFGSADRSRSQVTLNVVSSSLDHTFGENISIRNHLSYGRFDKFYQNVFPGAVSAADRTVSISGYNNATDRRNVFNQTDVTLSHRTGGLSHTVLLGAELGRQVTDNFRNTGFFDSMGPTVSTVAIPLDSPTTTLPMTFRQAASDADNHGVATIAAAYLQDQLILSDHLQAIAGLRYDRFSIDFRNNRTGARLSSTDGLVSPRLGLIVKPTVNTSLYGSYSLSYLPRAGEQLSSLTIANRSLDPEVYRNYEVGAKWDPRPGLEVTMAAYRLDRGKVAVPDPLDPTVQILVDGQRSTGVELGLTGNLSDSWSVATAYAYQDGEITRSQAATAVAGSRLAQLPKHSLSIWNKYDFTDAWGAGLGVLHRSDIFTSTDNLVTLPGFTRVDAAVFHAFTSQLRLQVNVENLFNRRYYLFAHNNNNITPGSPVAARVAVTTRF